jgi:hypothetical protein
MPIKAENKLKYPSDWKIIRELILDRSHHRCEQCGIPNHAVGYRDKTGRFKPLQGSKKYNAAGQGLDWPIRSLLDYAEAQRIAKSASNDYDADYQEYHHYIVIVLTISHSNHNPADCRPENLRALCQKCHLAHDKQQHVATARLTRRGPKAMGDLFAEGTL